MNKRMLSILCCLALLFGCVGGLGVVAETTADLQACVTGATLTAINGAADKALLPTGTNLLTGLSKLSGSSSTAPNNGTLEDLYDGLYQGVNQDIVYSKNPDGTWYRPDERYATVGSNISVTRYVSYVTAATADALGYAQIGFDLGAATRVDTVAIGSTAEGANSAITHAQFSDPNFDGVETAFTKETRLHMVDVYVSDSADTLYDDANKVVSADYLNGDISAYKNSLAPLASLFTLDEAVTGRFVGFRMYVAGVDGSNGVSTTVNGKTAKWGWYSQVRISELGVFGEPVEGESDEPYTRVPVAALTDLPEGDSLIAGLTPTKPDGGKVNTKSTNLINLTDGNIQGLNQDVTFVLSEDATTATSGGNTYYSWIAPTSLVEAQGLDTTKTWYMKPENGRWLWTTTNDQRAVLYGGDPVPVYDMGAAARVDSILIASSLELTGATNNNYYNEAYDASKHVAMTDAQLANALKPITNDKRMLWTAKVYVGDDKANIISEENLVLEYDLGAKPSDALRNLWTLKTPAEGRYIAFDFNGATYNDLIRISELGVYGAITEVRPYVATTYNTSTMPANMTPKADNVLGQAVAAGYRYGATGGENKSGMLLGALVDGAYGGAASEKLCPGGNEYIYFTYDLGKVYSLDTLSYVGDGSDGANSVAVYVSVEDWATAQAGGIEPDAFYDGAIGTTSRQTNNKTDAIGLRFAFTTPLLGRYVTFRLQGCKNGGSMQVWAAEFAATGKDATVAPYDADEVIVRIPSAEENILAKAATAYYRAGNANYNSNNTALKGALVDGAMSATDKAMLTVDDDYVYITYDLGAPYDITSLLYAGDGADGANSVAVWVGNEKLASILNKGVEPLAFYDGGVGTTERVTNNKTDAVAVGFNLTATGRYITFRLGTCTNASYRQVWISEFAATGIPAPISAEKTETIVCVGDSITHGTVFTTPSTSDWNAIQLANNYPVQLERLLNDMGDDVHYNVINAGISASAVIGTDLTIPGTETTFPNSGNGTPTTWLVEQETRGLNYVQEADKVLIMLGTNDVHTTIWTARAPYYKEYYKKIIDAFREKNPEVEIYVVTSPYTSVSTHKDNLENGVVPMQKKMAADWGLPLIDVYEASKYHVEVLNGGDLSSFIDSNDISKGLSLHPDEDGQAVIAKACFDALTGDQNDLYVIGSEGAQIRGYAGGVPTGAIDLRFGMSLPSTGITMDDNYATQLTDNSQITIAGKTYTVTGLGTVVAVKDKLNNPYVDLVAGVKDDWAKDVKAKKLYGADENGVTYTAVVTGIDEANYDSTLVARGYVQYQDGDTLCYAYGPLVTRSASEVVAAHTLGQLNPTYDEWRGYQRMTFTAGGVECYLVLPDEFAEGNPWIWRTEFFDAGSIATDLELLDAGWALGYCKVSNMYGNPQSVSIMKQFYNAVVPLANLDRQAVLEGLSRGGLYAVNYAATYPNDVAGLSLDAPVQDVCSWPGSLYSGNTGDAGCWADCKNDYGFSSDAAALADRTASPRWKYDILLENNIPVLLVYGDADNVVPFAENGQHLVDAYTAAGKTDLLKVKCFEGRGHSHGWTGEASAHIISSMN